MGRSPACYLRVAGKEGIDFGPEYAGCFLFMGIVPLRYTKTAGYTAVHRPAACSLFIAAALCHLNSDNTVLLPADPIPVRTDELLDIRCRRMRRRTDLNTPMRRLDPQIQVFISRPARHKYFETVNDQTLPDIPVAARPPVSPSHALIVTHHGY